MGFKRKAVYLFVSSMYLKLHGLDLDLPIKPAVQVFRPHLRRSPHLPGALPGDRRSETAVHRSLE